MRHNVTLRVLDRATGRLIQEQKGHNSATNTMIEGIGHYLTGAGVLRQGYSMLERFVPQYISLGTMGLLNQDEDSNHLPAGIDFDHYMQQRPGFGSDGYSDEYNNGRPYHGLGPAFTSFSTSQSYYTGNITYYKGVAYRAKEDMPVDPDTGTYNYWKGDQWEVSSSQPTCYELISQNFPRSEITFRDVVPENESELARSIDVVFSAMITTGALEEFRQFYGKSYIFITEAGLWSEKDYIPDNVSYNGLLAGYRLVPPNSDNWDMSIAANREILKKQILRVEADQVVQVIWKIQLANFEDIKDKKT